MKNHTMFSYDYLFSDYFANVSVEAKIYYIKLNFYAEYGFVPNPLEILKSLGYNKAVFMELVRAEEILTLPSRKEVFITSYYIHNYRFSPFDWQKSPFAIYWKGKLFIKKNGVATFKGNSPHLGKQKRPEMLDNIKAPHERKKKKERDGDGESPLQPDEEVIIPPTTVVPSPSNNSVIDDEEWKKMLEEIENSGGEF